MPLLLFTLFLLASEISAQTFSGLQAEDVSTPHVARIPDGRIVLAGTYDPPGDEEDARVWVRQLSADAREVLFTKEFDGDSWDSVLSLQSGADGFIYLLVTTSSLDFPTTPDALERTKPNSSIPATVLMKLDAEGELVLSSYLLTAAEFRANDLTLGPNRDILLTGVAGRNALTSTPGSYRFDGETDIFDWVTVRLSPDLQVRWATVGVGGARIATDQDGNVYVLGASGPESYPVTDGAFQPRPPLTFCGGLAGFPCSRQRLSKLSADGSRLHYSTFLTGDHQEMPAALIVDDTGQAHVVGTTTSQNYPTTEAAFERENTSRVPGFRSPGTYSGYATLVNADGTGLIHSTYFGGAGLTWVRSAALAPDGRLLVAGETSSVDFPEAPVRPWPCLPDDLNSDTTQVAQVPWSGRREQSFVLELSPGGDEVLRSELLVGRRNKGFDLHLDPDGMVLLAGTSELGDIPSTPGRRQVGPAGEFGTYRASYLAGFDLTSPRASSSFGCLTEPTNYHFPDTLSPLQVLTLFGEGFGVPEPVSPNGQAGFPTQIQDVEVLFDGVPAPLIFAKHDHLNLVAPSSIAARETTTLELRIQGETVARREYLVQPRKPHVFIDPDRTEVFCTSERGGYGGAFPLGRFLLADGRLNDCDALARPGSRVALFLNGLGLAPGSPPEGRAATETSPLGLPVEVLVGNRPATIEYAGPAVGQVAGIWQVNIRLPEDFAPATFADFGFAPLDVRVLVDGQEADPGRTTLWIEP